MNRVLFACVNLLVVFSREPEGMKPLAINRFFTPMRRQTRAVYSVALAGRTKHLMICVALGTLGLLSGLPEWLCLAFASVVILLEIFTGWGHAALPAHSKDVSVLQALGLMAICLVSSSIFMLSGLALSLLGDQAYVVLGLIVSFGIISHVTITYAPFPVFNMAQLLPNLAILYRQIYEIHRMDLANSPQGPWLLTAAGLIVFTVNLFETRGKTHHTFVELRKAQRDANVRLRELEYHSQHDALTGLLNRRAFDTKVGQLARRSTGLKDTAVCVLDLDAFKPINDSYSHDAGDTVLKEVAARITHALQPGDIVARAGGDEFIMVLTNISASEAAIERARAVQTSLARPILWNGKWLSLTASIGIALETKLDGNIAKLLSQADQAMYRAKHGLNHAPQLFQDSSFAPRPTLQDRSVLARAMANGEFKPYYQPKVDLGSGEIVGFEALARWEQSNGTVQMPGTFLGLIDELGLQGEFVTTMTRSVMRDVQSWLVDGLDPGQVSINLPEVSLATHTGRADLLDLTNEFCAVREHITFEITEDVFIARAADHIRETIRLLRDAGVRISLDDFGTGFASFRHLRELDFDELKIDASFTRALGTDRSSDILVQGLISIAQGLNVDIIAEGIETGYQHDQLVQMGCLVGQGFLWDEALAASYVPLRLKMQPHQINHVAAS